MGRKVLIRQPLPLTRSSAQKLHPICMSRIRQLKTSGSLPSLSAHLLTCCTLSCRPFLSATGNPGLPCLCVCQVWAAYPSMHRHTRQASWFSQWLDSEGFLVLPGYVPTSEAWSTWCLVVMCDLRTFGMHSVQLEVSVFAGPYCGVDGGAVSPGP